MTSDVFVTGAVPTPPAHPWGGPAAPTYARSPPAHSRINYAVAVSTWIAETISSAAAVWRATEIRIAHSERNDGARERDGCIGV